VREYLGEAYVIQGKFDLAEDEVSMTAALCRKRASESLTDVKEMENRKPCGHKKVLINAIRSSRIWSKEVEEELCDAASEACFEGEASK
jgi:hypothetical protein